jgi:type VI secretion system protein ImpA
MLLEQDDGMFTLEEFVSPITEEQFAGIDPRSDISPNSTYYTLKDLRNQLRAAERNALVDDEGLSLLTREWSPLFEQCKNAIKNESKDIEYVAWLIEALCRLEGFKGLALGFDIAHTLIENHFLEIFPALEDGEELSDKVSALVGLNGIAQEGALIMPIKSIPLTDGVSHGPFTFWEYQQAYDISRMPEDKREKKIAQGAVNYEDVEKSANESSVEFFVNLKADIERAIYSFSILSDVMDKVTGSPQPTSNIKRALDLSAAAIEHIGKNKLEQAAENVASSEPELLPEEEQVDKLVTSGQRSDNGKIDSRDSAIKKLSEIAVYFRETEPHSPMSYTIEQVIRWSKLSLPELLDELITDKDARSGYFKLSGIKVSETET